MELEGTSSSGLAITGRDSETAERLPHFSLAHLPDRRLGMLRSADHAPFCSFSGLQSLTHAISVNLSVSDQGGSHSGDGFAEHRTAGPTPLQVAIAEHRTGLVTATVAGHFAHWQYLTRFRRINLHATANRRPLATAGLAWGLVYLGVLSTITFAQRSVSRRQDLLLLRRSES
ncbi:hypothetical protein FZEAL_859 [Fusarium zealandicum]|uniref:Uncharacterized protein n=1 Tax=Fusarium zealandicum TaxID=1053134 RepID=A0A8H4UUD2_9HYPO|nr:hypothetical protein FZEAL_859 [Fusarium zealandicum]